jgi:hypothetical protein
MVDINTYAISLNINHETGEETTSQMRWKGKEEVYITPQTMGSGTHHPSTMKPDKLPPNFSKPDKSPPEVVWDGGFATVTVVLNFSFLFRLKL